MKRLGTDRTLVAGLVISLSLGAHGAARAQAKGPPPTTPVEQARIDSMRRPYNKADIDFMSGMISHHAQAIEMAKQAESHGASQSVVIYAGRVAMAQTAEIGIMQGWLRDRNQPVPPADSKGMKMVMNGVEMIMPMPGMLTEAQMKMLDAARGRTWDRLFLTFMIQHHNGALVMVDTLFNSYGAAQDETVFKFATAVHADQTTEIERMRLMLEAMAAGRNDP